MQSAPGPRTVLDGRHYLYFAGTGYLGLQADPRVLAAAQSACQSLGVHTATTRGGYGSSPPVLEVEMRAAQFLAAESSCYLVSGYAVNFAVAATFHGRADLVFIDEFAHDCLREATRWIDGLSRPPLAFRHRDPSHLAELLRAALPAGARPLVLTDGVFAASGSLAPLCEYLTVLDEYTGAMLLVDDAHGLAVLGTEGRGSLELAGVPAARVNVHVPDADRCAIYHATTLSKAIGGHGGVIAGTREFLDEVRRSSGWFRGSSAPAAPVAAATARALEIVQSEPALRRQLAERVLQARTQLRTLGLDIESSPAPIISIRLESAQAMQRVQQRLLAEGVAVAYTQNYAGAGPDGMLRIAVFATHTPQMIGQLVETLGRVL